jgi:uncharacterized membrane protein
MVILARHRQTIPTTRKGQPVMKTYLIGYVATGLVILLLDVIWLLSMTRLLYRPLLGPILLDTAKLAPAALFYFIYVFGVVFFAVAPALSTGRWTTALIHGALLGLVAYATYDLTNLATLKGWSGVVSLADICWGAILSATAAVLGFILTQAIVKVI